MEMTFKYFANSGTSFGLYGQKAYEILQCISTSGIIDDQQALSHPMMRTASMQRYKLFDKPLVQGCLMHPAVRHDGQIGMVRFGYITEKYLQDTGYATEIVIKNVGRMLALMKTISTDENEKFYFYTEDGEKTATMTELKCFRYLIEKKNQKKAASLYGEDTAKAIIGEPMNFLKASANKVVLENARTKLAEIDGSFTKDWKVLRLKSYSSPEEAKAEMQKLCNVYKAEVLSVLEESKKTFKSVSDEDFDATFKDATSSMGVMFSVFE